MEWNEILTLVLSAISVIFTAGIGVATIILNVKISKINNIKEYKENNRHITPFELQFRDEEWLYDLIVNRDEFYKYDTSSQKRIVAWFDDYAKNHNLTKLKVYNKLMLEEQVKEAKEKTDKEVQDTKEENEQETIEVTIPRPKPSGGRSKKVKVTNIDPALAELAARIRIGGKLPGTLHDYPVTGILKPTPIIIDLKDEFDEEDDKK